MRIHQITVFRIARRIELIVEMPDPDHFLTSQVPHLSRNIFRLLPSMAEHICHNDHGVPFKEECRETEIPHLFEHLILELQGQAQSTTSLRGETEWDWRVDPKGFFHVTVDYENEFLAIGAIRLAERMILALDGKNIERLDMAAELERLRELARLGREMEPMVWGFSAGNGTEPPTGTNSKEAKGRRRMTRTWEEITLQSASQPQEATSISA